MTMQTVSYKRGYIHYGTADNSDAIIAVNECNERKECTTERQAREFLNRYNGHKNWTHWNVSLYINNEESLYFAAREYQAKYGTRKGAKKLLEELPKKTPDGATYSLASVMAAISDINT